MAQDLERLKTERAHVKGTLTRLESFVNGSGLEQWSHESLEARRDRLLLAFQRYEDLQLRILEIDQNDKEDISVYEEKYYSILSILNSSLRKSGSQIPQASNLSVSNLPDMDLPKFDGRDFTKYKPFIDMFMAIIDSNKSLPNIAKFCYLKKYLLEEALSVVSSL